MLDRVIAVIDLQRGRAVRGIAGRRAEYQPVFFNQTDWSDPLALARFYLRHRVGGLYVADLDALTGGAVQIETLARLLALGCPIWIDAGIRGEPAAELSRKLLQSPQVHWVLATESFGLDRESSHRWLGELPAERLTVSIDLMRGQLLTPASTSQKKIRGGGEPIAPEGNGGSAALKAIAFFYALGFRSFLVLDLASVGGGGGPCSIELCRSARAEFADIQLISGGGVRGRMDLAQLFAAGVDYALVASALQEGTIFVPSPLAKD